MEYTKYQRLLNDCQKEIADDNLEKCFELLEESLDERQSIFAEVLLLKGRLSMVLREKNKGTIYFNDYRVERNSIRDSILDFLNRILKEEHVSLLRRIHDRILIIACKNSPTKWDKLFNNAFFSHVEIIFYKDDVPNEFKNSDVVIFDDLDCGVKNHVHMSRYILEMPMAHILYVGADNPLKEDDPPAFKRCANANSEITILARLRELLEFRKVYGLPEA